MVHLQIENLDRDAEAHHPVLPWTAMARTVRTKVLSAQRGNEVVRPRWGLRHWDPPSDVQTSCREKSESILIRSAETRN